MKHSILAILSITGVISIFIGYHLFIVIQQHKHVDNKLIVSMKESIILKQEIGKIKDIKKTDNSSFKNYEDNLYWSNFTIILDNNGKNIVKVIVENETLIIYAYEINGKVIYENIE